MRNNWARFARMGVAAALFAGIGAPAFALPLGLGGPGLGPVLRPVLQPIQGTLQGVTGDVTGTVGSTLNVVRDQVGRPRRTSMFEKDLLGARVVKGEILALSPSDAGLAAAQRLHFEVARQETIDSLGLNVTVLRVPDGMSASDALVALRKADPGGSYDYDHIYNPSGDISSSTSQTTPTQTGKRTAIKIGMIDGGIERRNRAFSDAAIVPKNFAGDGDSPATMHGTAVASLLVGDDEEGALSHATLYAADVYGGDAAGGAADNIARALGWLASNDVPVANISLAGPPNVILEAATKAFLKRGHVIVAAVGNDGPAAPIEFPAGYAGVAGVTSVDRDRKIQIDANCGDVSFAALGVDVRAAIPNNGRADMTGTSFAAPVVAVRFALLMKRADPAEANAAWEQLKREAIHIGAPGRDPVFGYGFLDAADKSALIAAQ
ncbi:MAG TPA: S8 family serine peptidase [Rhizomicrobium sp.]